MVSLKFLVLNTIIDKYGPNIGQILTISL